jgi:NAD(P)-dependent dehydrogenase (short-subunit alcohol dehydrogenase family)
VRSVARQANDSGLFDAVIHNAGVGYRESRKIVTADGLSHVFAINVLAPYLLTALITPPGRLVYLSSGMHRGGDPDLADLQWARRLWNRLRPTPTPSCSTDPHPAVTDTDIQNGLLAACAEPTGTPLPTPGRPASHR